MNRRTVLSLAATATAFQVVSSTLITKASGEFESGGLGLTTSDWEVMFGPGEAGQTYYSFALEDGAYNVGGDGMNGPIHFIERTWTDPTGMPIEMAEAEAQMLIPADAKLLERYNAESARILYGTQIDRYESKSLGALFAGEIRKLTKFFAVVIEKVPATDVFGFNASRMVIVVGEEAAG